MIGPPAALPKTSLKTAERSEAAPLPGRHGDRLGEPQGAGQGLVGFELRAQPCGDVGVLCLLVVRLARISVEVVELATGTEDRGPCAGGACERRRRSGLEGTRPSA